MIFLNYSLEKLKENKISKPEKIFGGTGVDGKHEDLKSQLPG